MFKNYFLLGGILGLISAPSMAEESPKNLMIKSTSDLEVEQPEKDQANEDKDEISSDLNKPINLRLVSAQTNSDSSAASTDAAAPAPDAAAPAPKPSILNRPQLTGDWGGMRTKLAEKGFYFEFRQSNFYQGVASGGVSTGGAYTGLMDYIVNVDAHKLGLWEGLAFNVHATTRWGHDILANAGGLTLPNTATLYPLPGDYHGTNITGIMAVQTLFKGKAQILVGKLNVVDLVSGVFPDTLDYGQKGFLNPLSTLVSLPVFRWVGISVWGAGGWLIKDGMASTGLIMVGQRNVTNTLSLKGSFSEGVGFLGFHRFTFEIGGNPGYVLLLGGLSTKEFPSLDPSDWLIIPGAGLQDTAPKKPWNIGAYFYQVLWQEGGKSPRKTQLMLGATAGNDNPNFSGLSLFAKVEAFGPFASRPNDRAGIAVWYSTISGNLKNLVAVGDIFLRDYWGFEVYYNIEITPAIYLTPDLQIIRNENVGDKIAIIPGVRLVLEF